MKTNKVLTLALASILLISLFAVAVSADCNFFCRLKQVITGKIVAEVQALPKDIVCMMISNLIKLTQISGM